MSKMCLEPIAKIFCFSLLLCFSTLRLYGQDPAIEPARPLPGDWEVFRSDIPVSGSLLVGVVAGEGSGNLRPGDFVVLLNKSDESRDARLCVTIASIDGRYRANLSYEMSRLSSSTSRVRQLSLPTKYVKELRSYDPKQLAILSSINESCSSEPESYLISSWYEVPRVDTLSVFINSDVYASVIGGQAHEIEFEYTCRRMRGDTKTFNRECRLPLSEVDPRATLEIRQRTFIGTTNLSYYELPLLK